MLTDAAGTLAISSLGWVDGARLWVFHRRGERVEHVPTSPARHLTLHPGTDDHFAVVHHRDGEGLEVSVLHFADLVRPLARAVVHHQSSSLHGDREAWSRVPKCYTGYVKGPAEGAYELLRIDPVRGMVEHRPIQWFDDRYDRGYQSIMGATEVPGESRLLVSVQRSSRLVLHDPETGAESGHVDLGTRGGNPELRLRRNAPELWAMDYDTIVKVEPGSWRVIASRRVQGAFGQMNQFAGGFAFDPDEKVCVVARPFSRDVIGLDPRTLRTRWRCWMLRQPLDVALFTGGEVVARDWKTGDLLRGKLRHTWW